MKIKIISCSRFGPVAVVWENRGSAVAVIRVLLSRQGVSAEAQTGGLYPGVAAGSCPRIDALAARIKAFLSGAQVSFPLDCLDWRQCSAFQKAVFHALYRIPHGSVTTYRLIARNMGNNHAARAVGSALAANPFPLIIPCHRAVRSDCYPGGFQGGEAMKISLLRQEGVIFDSRGRVSTNSNGQ